MQTFEREIKSLRPIGWHTIKHYYDSLFMDAIVVLLDKLGYKENMEFVFDPKKRKNRMDYSNQDIIGIRYSRLKNPQEFLGGEMKYEFLIRYYTGDPDPLWDENIMVIPPICPNGDFWDSIYNYLRIEAKGSRKNKNT